MSQPINGANTTVAAYCALLKMAVAVPRSFDGNHAATMRPFAGNDGASATPTRKRSVNNVTLALAPVRSPTTRVSSVHTDHATILAAYTRFDPKRSSSQ